MSGRTSRPASQHLDLTRCGRAVAGSCCGATRTAANIGEGLDADRWNNDAGTVRGAMYVLAPVQVLT